MIYIFRSPFKLQNGSVIKEDEAVFVDDLNATDEVALEVKKRLEAENTIPAAEPKKKK